MEEDKKTFAETMTEIFYDFEDFAGLNKRNNKFNYKNVSEFIADLKGLTVNSGIVKILTCMTVKTWKLLELIEPNEEDSFEAVVFFEDEYDKFDPTPEKLNGFLAD